MYLVGFGLIIPLIPTLAQDFGATGTQVGLLMACYSGMQFLSAPFWGRLSDKWGRRPILIWCLIGEACTYVIFAYATDLNWLFASRILAGLFGGSISTASAYISDVTDQKTRSQGMALIGVSFGLGFLIGPALGGVLAHFGGVRLATLTVAGLCAGTALFGFLFLKESLKKGHVQSASLNRRQLLEKYLTNSILGKVIFCFFISTTSMALMEASLVLYMRDQFQWHLKEVTFGFAYIGLVSLLAQGLLVRRLLPKLGERTLLKYGFFALSLSLVTIPFIPVAVYLVAPMTLLAIATSFINPALYGSVSLLATEDSQGEAMGAAQSLSSLGRVVGPAIGGWLYTVSFSASPFLLGGLFALVGFILIVRNFSQLPENAKITKASI